MKLLLVALVCVSAVYGKTLQRTLYNPKDFLTSGFIVGGTDARPGEFPHQVSFQNLKDSTGQHSHNCGGSIINENFILTAAHCVDPSILPPNQPRIIAGMHKHSTDEQNSKQIIAVDKIISHPEWNYEKLSNDVAILKLAEPLQFNEYVQPTKLPSSSYQPGGTLTVSGWGLLVTGGDAIPDTLQKVQIPHYDFQMCKTIFEIFGLEIKECHLCAGGMGEELGVCNGDSGGPLLAADGTQVGVVSFGAGGCGSAIFPAVFANVVHFSTWIQQTISSN